MIVCCWQLGEDAAELNDDDEDEGLEEVDVPASRDTENVSIQRPTSKKKKKKKKKKPAKHDVAVQQNVKDEDGQVGCAQYYY